MMKSKFMAGLVATVICLVLVVVAAIVMVSAFDTDPSDRMTKVIAFAVIGIWVALFAWLKPKDTNTNNGPDLPKKES